MFANRAEKIQAAVQWYAALDAGFADIATLMEARRRLACHLFAFAVEVGELGREKNRVEHLRKSKYARIVAESLEKSDGKGVAAAQVAAEHLTSHERGEEAAAEAAYYAAKVVMDAGNNVLDTMNQHISNLKAERRLEFSGQGSQN